MTKSRRPALVCLVGLLAGCASDLPTSSPPLVDLEEPLALLREPDDEARRKDLALGSFSGLEVVDARVSMEEIFGASAALEVERVIENSPAQGAGIEAGDLILSARAAGGERIPLAYPSEWRALELAHAPGTELELEIDRAGKPARATIVFAARVAPRPRVASERFSEEQRVGVVVRSATEVEAREAGLAPGAGAVIVGLSRGSPWREAGLAFGDLVAAVDGIPLAHAAMLIEAVRAAEEDARLELQVLRAGARRTLDVTVSRRAGRISAIAVPILFSYSHEGARVSSSLLLGLVGYERTQAAWRLRLLWFFGISGGDSDRLVEVDP